MIEIIYDKDKSEKDQEELNEEKEVSIGLKLPKNIRQVGNPSPNKRIYIEDYVVTYLNYIARPGSTQARGAILLGEVKQSDIGNVIFISGAVEAQNIEFDIDESEFTEEAWTRIYEQVKEFFPNLSVVGWFLSRMGFSTAINDKIEKMHVDNFPGRDKVLYVEDSLEADEAFYMYDRGQLVKQKGYYIYYSRNEAMQSYIVNARADISEDKSEIQRKDEELIKRYRDKTELVKNSNKGNNYLYVAGAVLVLGIISMGASVISNHDKMKKMEVTINRLELTAEQNDEVYTQAMSNFQSNGKIATPTDEKMGQEGLPNNGESNIESGEDSLENDINENNNNSTEDESKVQITKQQYLPAMTSGNPTYYRIRKGDSLTSIALEYYGDIKYAKNIAKANKMDETDSIYEGEEIILPAIKDNEEDNE